MSKKKLAGCAIAGLGALILVPIIWALVFGLGYAFGLGIEWLAGKPIPVGPLRLPYWTGIAFVVLQGIGQAASSE